MGKVELYLTTPISLPFKIFNIFQILRLLSAKRKGIPKVYSKVDFCNWIITQNTLISPLMMYSTVVAAVPFIGFVRFCKEWPRLQPFKVASLIAWRGEETFTDLFGLIFQWQWLFSSWQQSLIYCLMTHGQSQGSMSYHLPCQLFSFINSPMDLLHGAH